MTIGETLSMHRMIFFFKCLQHRYFGLKSLVNSTMGPDMFPVIESVKDDELLNPVMLLLCYYSSVIFLRDIREMKRSNTGKLEDVPLHLMNDKNCHSSFSAEEGNLTQESDPETTSVKRFVCFARRHSNIASNLMMMVIFNGNRHCTPENNRLFFVHSQIWSIVFRSWLSIVFLLVVSVLWMRPIERKSAHRINLFIVFYADFLLILQYFYCMILTADELPLRESGVLSILAQIGVVRYETYPCIPLLFMAICLLTFCLTLHQKLLELTHPNSFRPEGASIGDKTTILKCFNFGISVLTHLWVAMILITIFIYSVYGSEVNLLKLCYMAYLLAFVMSYQISLDLWRKLMYALWMLVIVSSMSHLIAIYTYQFDGFEFLWENYLGINKHMQVIWDLSSDLKNE